MFIHVTQGLEDGSLTGLGCDVKTVIHILGHRTQLQRSAIADAYQRQYGESIHKRLKSELHFKLEVRTSKILSHFETGLGTVQIVQGLLSRQLHQTCSVGCAFLIIGFDTNNTTRHVSEIFFICRQRCCYG